MTDSNVKQIRAWNERKLVFTITHHPDDKTFMQTI